MQVLSEDLIDLHVPLMILLEVAKELLLVDLLLLAHATEHLLDACAAMQLQISGQAGAPLQTGPTRAG